MTLQEIHQHLSAWPQRSVALSAEIAQVVVAAATEVADALPESAIAALSQYKFIANEPAQLQVVLNRDVLLAMTSALVSTASISQETEGE